MKLGLLVAAMLLAAAPAVAAEKQGQEYTYKDRFTVVFPAGWDRNPEVLGLTDEEKKVYGAEFLGPASGPVRTSISVLHYAPGNLLHKTHEKYIKLHSSPPLGDNLDGKVYGKVSAGKAGNYYARVFERKTFEYFPKRSLDARKYFIYEKFTVVPVKNGFFVLRYSAPAELARKNLAQYEALVASFKPLMR